MTAKEALKIALLNSTKEIEEIVSLIEYNAKIGRGKMVLDYELNDSTINLLR